MFFCNIQCKGTPLHWACIHNTPIEIRRRILNHCSSRSLSTHDKCHLTVAERLLLVKKQLVNKKYCQFVIEVFKKMTPEQRMGVVFKNKGDTLLLMLAKRNKSHGWGKYPKVYEALCAGTSVEWRSLKSSSEKNALHYVMNPKQPYTSNEIVSSIADGLPQSCFEDETRGYTFPWTFVCYNIYKTLFHLYNGSIYTHDTLDEIDNDSYGQSTYAYTCDNFLQYNQGAELHLQDMSKYLVSAFDFAVVWKVLYMTTRALVNYEAVLYLWLLDNEDEASETQIVGLLNDETVYDALPWLSVTYKKPSYYDFTHDKDGRNNFYGEVPTCKRYGAFNPSYTNVCVSSSDEDDYSDDDDVFDVDCIIVNGEVVVC
eukprot:TRINITY_DN10584_c0_g1_i4.p1 TRINITY_DN10584_c0_g1~~TRINITY_DN10584_c0_g1_i4.p1  ORF type:complete len:370 (+),score=50.69 TRINITY_DN10584_c0_g1_i4:897-2006(+)